MLFTFYPWVLHSISNVGSGYEAKFAAMNWMKTLLEPTMNSPKMTLCFDSKTIDLADLD